MARRKKARRKGKRRATKAQLRALKKAHAANRRKHAKKRKPKRRKTAKRRKTSRKRSVAHHMRAASRRGFQPQSSGGGVASHYHSGSRSYAANIAKASKRRRRKAKGMKRFSKKSKGGVVTAASIIKGARSQGYKAWVCAGPKRSGCGGGRKGGHVVGILK